MKKNVLFLLLLGLLTTVSAQPTHRIKGTVIDKASRQPLEFINVLVLGLGRGGVTDAEGHFNIGEVPPGIYRLQASAVGYKTILTPEYIVSTKDLTIQIETEENLTELAGVTVTASPFRRDPESPVRAAYHRIAGNRKKSGSQSGHLAYCSVLSGSCLLAYRLPQ